MILAVIGMALIVAEAIDALSRPRAKSGRTLRTFPLRLVMSLLWLGLLLAFFGSIWISCVSVILISAAIITGSNLKFRILGEPLVFSDLAIVAAAYRFPRLYLFAIPNVIRCVILFCIAVVVFGIIEGFVTDWRMHLLGVLLATGSFIVLQASISSPLMQKPDLLNDVRLHGVALTLFFYWQRWFAIRDSPIEAPVSKLHPNAELIIVVQNESFCDPQDINGENDALPGLSNARQSAWAWGNLAVSSFGASTMRAEYGVLCGIEESTLGFRRYDPFPTAGGQASSSLPACFPDHQSIFLHPYDLRFFGRDDLMQRLGFAEILGRSAVPAPATEEGPYVSDLVLAGKLATYIENASPSFIYTVTMENHGPWTKGRVAGQPGGWPGYLHHLRNGDAMLEVLITALRESNRNAVLAFFGDHRPSIPGVVEDQAERHTPYVILRFNNGDCHPGPGRLDLTPAGLHHAILAAASITFETPLKRRHGRVVDAPVPQG